MPLRGTLLLLTLLAGAGQAQDEHLAYEVVQTVLGCLEDLEPELVPGELGEEPLALVARNPRQACILCQAAAREARRLADDDPAATGQALDAIGKLVERMREQDPEGASTHRASGELLLARARVLRQTGRGDPRDLYRKAAGELHDAHLLEPGDGQPAVRSLLALHELCELRRVDLEEICTTSETWAQQAREAFPDSPDVLRMAAQSDVLQARFRARRERSRARKLLERAVDSLAPHLTGDDPPLELATVHNEAVEVDRLHRVGLGAATLSVTQEVAEGGLLLDLPRSRRWITREQLEELEQGNPRLRPLHTGYEPALTVLQFNEHRELVALLHVFVYEHSGTYTVGGHITQGDNPKGLAQRELEALLHDLQKARGSKKVGRRTCSSQVGDTTSYELAGRVPGGDPVRVEAYFWRSQPLGKSFSLMLVDYSGQRSTHPLWIEILASARLQEPD